MCVQLLLRARVCAESDSLRFFLRALGRCGGPGDLGGNVAVLGGHLSLSFGLVRRVESLFYLFFFLADSVAVRSHVVLGFDAVLLLLAAKAVHRAEDLSHLET